MDQETEMKIRYAVAGFFAFLAIGIFLLNTVNYWVGVIYFVFGFAAALGFVIFLVRRSFAQSNNQQPKGGM